MFSSEVVELRDTLAALPPEESEAILEEWVSGLEPEEALELAYLWEWHSRPDQLPPPRTAERPWSHWHIWAGRGWGKTRTGAEAVRVMKESVGRIALVGRTITDALEVMVDGESGLLAVSPPWDRPRVIRSSLRPKLEWGNGAKGFVYSSKNYEALRGPQHGGYWADELAAWYYLEETWDNLQMGLRLGSDPWGIVTTTPRPIKFLKEINEGLEDVIAGRLRYNPRARTYVTHGRTYDNLRNLAPTFRQIVLERYEGTRKGAQELDGRLLAEVDGALWSRDLIDSTRVRLEDLPDLERVIVAIDPPGSKSSGMAGIVAYGVKRINRHKHTYCLDDWSGSYSPGEWAARAVALYLKWSADRIVAERNYGGEMVEHTINTSPGGEDLSVKLVHATKGKEVRAEPALGLMEQGRDHHVGHFAELEDELCEWVPGESDYSPNRLDAKVWAITDLAVTGRDSRTKVRGEAVG